MIGVRAATSCWKQLEQGARNEASGSARLVSRHLGGDEVDEEAVGAEADQVADEPDVDGKGPEQRHRHSPVPQRPLERVDGRLNRGPADSE
eukprot:1948932-Rhodomonas_salina.1